LFIIIIIIVYIHVPFPCLNDIFPPRFCVIVISASGYLLFMCSFVQVQYLCISHLVDIPYYCVNLSNTHVFLFIIDKPMCNLYFVCMCVQKMFLFECFSLFLINVKVVQNELIFSFA